MPFNWYDSKVNPLSFLPKRRDLLAGVRLRVRADFVQLLVFPNDLAESSVFAGPLSCFGFALQGSSIIYFQASSDPIHFFAPSKRRQWHILLLQRFLDSSHPPFANASVHRWWPKRGHLHGWLCNKVCISNLLPTGFTSGRLGFKLPDFVNLTNGAAACPQSRVEFGWG